MRLHVCLHLCPDTPWGLEDTSRVCNGFGPAVLGVVTGLAQSPLPNETVIFCAFGLHKKGGGILFSPCTCGLLKDQ